MSNLKGQIALVTGASRGLGRAIALELGAQGGTVVGTATSDAGAAEIQQAFADYRRTGFGGWPWDRPDPVHGRDAGRFAHHADGRIEQPDAAGATTA